MKVSPKLTLVGAGPGDPDLITVKGLKAIAEADVVLYDALISEELLIYAPQRAVKLFVGKRAGYQSFKQDEINQLIISHAFQYGHVVRLKGGDPFVFGRASEEIEAAESFGIPVEVIPGLSSATAIPSQLQIPLTQRNVSRGFRVMTATTTDNELNEDINNVVKSNDTVIILMGLHKLEKIVQVYQDHAKGDLPAVIVQNGTLPDEKIVAGRVQDLVSLAKQEEIGAPAIIVIGESVEFFVKQRKAVVELAKL
ncbi:uroporphyrinogen-III C-methyltransferase [Thermoflexibacter ruber]|uniref:uroporphyrinogen-III C-methyltransferase n=1 Tax=Thermoflexibacter ruber TaxID=1003 RepID=A0A1I2IQ41_9BACT|nr:uroporphyrinogen-III C-methyltransferase [Thermoflexibacter ruber]SFF43768.1 uroporphyrinogen-III C-methyltransferase [Thermoflexibacter ruber]